MEERLLITDLSYKPQLGASMAVEGHYKDEKFIYIIYTSLREASLWRFPKDGHTESAGNMKKVSFMYLYCRGADYILVVFTSHYHKPR